MAPTPFENLGNRNYLVQHYVAATTHLKRFTEQNDKGDSTEARLELSRAAGAICEAFQRLADDTPFWDALAALREPVEKNKADISRTLEEIELFLAQEETVLLGYELPPVIVRQLLSDLALTLKALQSDFSLDHINELHTGIKEVRDTICAVSKVAPPDEPRDKFLDASMTVQETLGIVGGGVTIVVDSVAAAATLVSLVSIVAGLGSALGFLRWLKRRKKKRG